MQLVQPLLLLLISLILCIHTEVTPENTQDAREELESKECENTLVKNIPTNGIAELLNFINSLDNILMALKTYLAAQDTEYTTNNAKFEAQKVEISNLNSEVGRLTTRTNKLNKIAQMNPVTWKDFDDLITTQAKEIKTGNSYNGSSLSDIKSQASQFGYEGRYIAIVFVNYLDEAIDNFTIYEDNGESIYNAAPNSVPGRTREVFTFAPPQYNSASNSFSYTIPAIDVKIAVISYGGTFGTGLAFASKGTDMQTYYRSHKGIEGSSVWEIGEHNKDRYLSVGYKNFYARVFADSEGMDKASLRIELINIPLDD